MEEYNPCYVKIGRSSTIDIPPQHKSTSTVKRPVQSYCESQKNGIQLKTPNKATTKMKKKKKKKKKSRKNTNKERVSEDGTFHESVSRTSSYGSCSSSGSADLMNGSVVQPSLDACDGFGPSYYTEENATRRSKEKVQQKKSSFSDEDEATANGRPVYPSGSGQQGSDDKNKKLCTGQKHKNGQKSDLKRLGLCPGRGARIEQERVGVIRRIWNKLFTITKKREIRGGPNPYRLIEECEEAKGVMITNCEKLLTRHGNLEDLQDRGEELEKKCKEFFQKAKKLKNKHAPFGVRMRDALGRPFRCLCCCCPRRRESTKIT